MINEEWVGAGTENRGMGRAGTETEEWVGLVWITEEWVVYSERQHYKQKTQDNSQLVKLNSQFYFCGGGGVF